MRLFALTLSALVAVLILGMIAASAMLKQNTIGPPIAPDPQQHAEAIVQVYGADVWGFRGNFAIHTWIATKPPNAPAYTIYQVIGWRLRRNGTAVSITTGMPNKPWFRSPPLLLHEVRGSHANVLIAEIDAAVNRYPYDKEYVMWPGPNSNSFTEWIVLEVPGLGFNLPAKAIGKNWMQETYSELISR